MYIYMCTYIDFDMYSSFTAPSTGGASGVRLSGNSRSRGGNMVRRRSSRCSCVKIELRSNERPAVSWLHAASEFHGVNPRW